VPYLNRNLILECLKELSDRHLQESLWVAGISSQQSSLVEAVEGLFMDSGLGDRLTKGRVGFSQEAEATLRELEQQLTRVHSKGGPEEVMNDPAMPRIRDLAGSALELLTLEPWPRK